MLKSLIKKSAPPKILQRSGRNLKNLGRKSVRKHLTTSYPKNPRKPGYLKKRRRLKLFGNGKTLRGPRKLACAKKL
jgi:hypothetical protein